METSVQIVEISIIRYIPELVAWGIGIVLAVLMVRWGGDKAEKLLLAGCSLMFVLQLAVPLLRELVSLLLREEWRSLQTASLILQIPVTILGIAGLVCLVMAFWLRFRAWRQEPA